MIGPRTCTVALWLGPGPGGAVLATLAEAIPPETGARAIVPETDRLPTAADACAALSLSCARPHAGVVGVDRFV
ncbi:hypothetical protein BH24CHL6_BH24CHL6_12480 [soil metagenome]